MIYLIFYSPYESADLRKMALCFNTPLPDLEDELMQLILDGHIKARIDSINKVRFSWQFIRISKVSYELKIAILID